VWFSRYILLVVQMPLRAFPSNMRATPDTARVCHGKVRFRRSNAKCKSFGRDFGSIGLNSGRGVAYLWIICRASWMIGNSPCVENDVVIRLFRMLAHKSSFFRVQWTGASDCQSGQCYQDAFRILAFVSWMLESPCHPGFFVQLDDIYVHEQGDFLRW